MKKPFRTLVVTLLGITCCYSLLQAQKLLSDGLRDLADQIAARAQKEQKRRIAVATFRELDGRATVLGAFIAEDLTTKLVSTGPFDEQRLPRWHFLFD